jgi:putative transferase (TIGR04331 family)
LKKNNLVFTELSFKNRNNTIYITPWYRTKIDVLKKNNIKINTLEYQLLTPKQQKDAELFCKNKYFRYIEILSDRLNKYHNINSDTRFWSKSMNFWLYRNICIVYDKYIALENIDFDNYDFSILDKTSFFTPDTCDESYKLLSSSPYGVEQLCSVYCKLNVHKDISTFKISKFNHQNIPSGTIANIKNISKIEKLKLLASKLINKSVNRLKRESLKIFKKLVTPKIAIMDAYFSTKSILTLSFKSMFQIQEIDFVQSSKNYHTLDISGRKKIFTNQSDFDKFDKYFFESMKSLMPFSFIENFQDIYSSIIKENNHDLTHVISEAWLGNEFLSIELAIMQQKNIKHIHIQHGWVFMNNLNTMWLESYLSDIYLTSGSVIEDLSNIVKGGYVREQYNKIGENKRDDILFFSTASPAYTYQLDENVRDESFVKYLDKQIKFISLLDKEILNNFYYRKYPVDYGWGEIEKLISVIPEIKFDNVYVRGLDRISKAKLVIFDVFSTGYIEAIIANTPTVIIFDKEIRKLNKDFEDMIDKLSEVNVVFYNIEGAAKHINAIYKNPYKWWNSEKVQARIKEFIDYSARDVRYSENYILDLTK